MTHNGFFSDALSFYFHMLALKVEPDRYTFTSVINACDGLLHVGIGNVMHYHVLSIEFYSDLYVGNALIDMYARFNELGKDRNVFEEMPQRDIVSWNSIISGYNSNGYWEEALDLFKQSRKFGVVQDFAPVSSVLPACGGLVAFDEGEVVHGLVKKTGMRMDTIVSHGLLSMYYKFDSHSGLVEEGRAYFNQMKKHYKIEPQIKQYASVVDLLSRSGLLAEAEEFIISMPFRPDESIWGALFSACRSSGDIKIAERVSKHIVELNSQNTDYHILVSNVYATLGKWDKVRTIRIPLRNKGLKKDPGCSWSEIQKVYVFGTGDRHLEQYEEAKVF